MSQYTGSYETDVIQGKQCGSAFAAGSSLSQGQQFASLTKDFHGGKRNTRRCLRKNRRSSRMKRTRRMRGGAAEYPNSFDELLPQTMHDSAKIASLDNAFNDLPKFVGSYGSMTGGRRSRKMRKMRRMRGGVAPVDASSMILSAAEEPAAFLNPQWYTENQVVPSFQGPENAYAEQQYATQFSQQGGKKKTLRKRSKKNRKTRSRK